MALNIEGASIGFDSNNVEKALANLNVNVIQDTIKLMNDEMKNLHDRVSEAWIGESANTFKNNMSHDRETVAAALNQTYETLESEMHQIINEMAAADRELVKGRDA